ncbi:MAG TPA: hypothetical protein VF258_06835, partial [Luteolibacter sp.]
LAISCLAWIGAISFAVVYFMGTAASTGWIIGGVLFLALAAWIVVMRREIRNAIELPHSPSNKHAAIDAVEKSTPDRTHSGILDSRKMTPERGHHARPRKLRSGGVELPSLIGR